MERINMEIERLLEENRALFDGKPIAFDGVADESCYMHAKIKTLFLLKEVNWPNMSNDWIYTAILKETAYNTKTLDWPNICLWMEAMYNPNITYMDCIQSDGRLNSEMLQKHLREIALVNIKKTAGDGSSKHQMILDAIERYGHLIRKQIDSIILPQLVVCGGTFDYAKRLYPEAQTSVLPSGAMYFVTNGIVFLQFVHPSWFSVNRSILFAYAKTVFSDVVKLVKPLEE